MDNFRDIARHSNSGSKSRSTTTSVCTSASLGSPGIMVGVCPVCQSELKLLIINLEEKIIMCENLQCHYPFFEENIPIHNADSDMYSRNKYSVSKKTSDDASTTCSIVSSSWSDVEHITRALDSDCTLSEYRLKNCKKNVAQKEKVQKLLQNRDYVKNLTNEMKVINGIGRVKRITKHKYIKNLMSLQSITGAKILEPEELKVVEKDTDTRQLKINVNTDPENSVSCIEIELVDITKEEKRKEDKTDKISNI